MLISSPRLPQQIPLLPVALDRPVNMAACRNFCGDFFEEASANLFQGTRLKTDCTKDICPDIQVSPRLFLESKCIGNNGSAIIYTHRRDKDLKFMRENGVQIDYVFWRHGVPVQSVRFLSELRGALSRSFLTCLRIPAQAVHALVGRLPVRVLNTKTKTPNGKRLGYGSNGYGMGWSIPYSVLRRLCEEMGYETVRVYGLNCELDLYEARV